MHGQAHQPFQEEPDAFNALVDDFLQDLERRAR
jgi:pimeloyl-ACP methyl ester carboxylesterase